MCFYKIYPIYVPVPVPVPILYVSPTTTPLYKCSVCSSHNLLSFLKCNHIVCITCSTKMMKDSFFVCNECVIIYKNEYLKKINRKPYDWVGKISIK